LVFLNFQIWRFLHFLDSNISQFFLFEDFWIVTFRFNDFSKIGQLVFDKINCISSWRISFRKFIKNIVSKKLKLSIQEYLKTNVILRIWRTRAKRFSTKWEKNLTDWPSLSVKLPAVHTLLVMIRFLIRTCCDLIDSLVSHLKLRRRSNGGSF
jgi:hypothetical protein